MSDLAIRFEEDLPWETWDDAELKAKSPIRWKLLISGSRTPTSSLTQGIAELPPGETLLSHTHAQAETYYVISGVGKITIDEVVQDIGPGAAVYIPPNIRHSTTCVSEDPLVIIFTLPCDKFEDVNYHFEH